MPKNVNWNDLSDQLKHKCVGKMDFVTRVMLRSTSRNERKLVDRHKNRFEFVRIEEINGFPIGGVTVIPSSEKSENPNQKSIIKEQAIHLECENLNYHRFTLLPFLNFALKTGKIGRLALDISDEGLFQEVAKAVFRTENSKNWNDFSVELKLKIIEEMDFKTRSFFRQTARSNKNLVDSLPIFIDYIQFTGSSQKNSKQCTEFSFQIDNLRQPKTFRFTKKSEFRRKILPIFLYVLKVGIIDLFFCHYVPDLIDELVGMFYGWEIQKFKIRHLDFVVSRRAMFWFARNSDEKVLEHFETAADPFIDFPIDNLLTFPSVHNARKIEIHESYKIEILYAIIEKWIEIDASTGSTVIIYKPGNYYEISCRFEDRVIYEIPNEKILLTTNNPKKQIEIQIKHQDNFDYFDSVTCQIVEMY
ncbi:Protein CBG14998 [Caenorhabditis briggsae]|uniref:Protein CBG14998 n=1 Tax=Caenorhabditis briggsae TaxID=6238 RepID=A8XL64_CAEBR|nr:Protein CBG14998 [Caenorhabditis briggsae]CAP33389.2 Protein CBG14998 [Caenorhabditis briggsae]